MHGIVPELVNLAADRSVFTTDLLRKALVVASRTGADELVEWMNHELTGYGDAEIPSYRRIVGELVAMNPVLRRTIPILGLPEEWAPLRYHNLAQSLAELEELAKGEGRLTTYFPEEVETTLRRLTNPQLRPMLQFAPIQLIGVTQHVRGQVLNWALSLERRGVIGSGSLFSTQERLLVKNQNFTFNNVSGQIQIDSDGSSQTQGVDTKALGSLIEVLRSGIAKGDIPEKHVAEVQAEVDTLAAQAKSPTPKASIVRETVASLRSLLENAGGGVLATLASPYITALLGS